jgi:hypothetical protein
MSLGRAFSKNRPLHYAVAAAVGVASGVSIFDAPLRKAAAKRRAEAEAAAEAAAAAEPPGL